MAVWQAKSCKCLAIFEEELNPEKILVYPCDVADTSSAINAVRRWAKKHKIKYTGIRVKTRGTPELSEDMQAEELWRTQYGWF